jgi:hypothetical protein
MRCLGYVPTAGGGVFVVGGAARLYVGFWIGKRRVGVVGVRE